MINNEEAYLFGSTIWSGALPEADTVVDVDGRKGIICESGLLIQAADGGFINVQRLKINNKNIKASKYGKNDEANNIDFTEEEQIKVELLRQMWKNILNVDIEEETDFFACG